MPGSGIIDSYDNFIFQFLRNLHTVPIVAAPIYILTNLHSNPHCCAKGFPFLHTFSSICYL